MSGIDYRMIEAGGHMFEVACVGTGNKLALCLHGFPELAHSWRYQLPLLASLGYRAWAPNMRGYGNSYRPKDTSQYSLSYLIADVANLIDAAAAEQTVLIGHDWGGAVAWQFAIHEVRALSGLVIMNVPHPQRFMQALRMPRQLLKSSYMLFFQLPHLPEWLLGWHRGLLIAKMIRAAAADKQAFSGEDLRPYRENVAQKGALTAMLNYYRANASSRRSEQDRQGQSRSRVIHTPTLMLWGEQDPAFIKETTFDMEQLIADLTLRYIPEAGHWVQQESPAHVNAMLSAWLQGQPVPYADR